MERGDGKVNTWTVWLVAASFSSMAGAGAAAGAGFLLTRLIENTRPAADLPETGLLSATHHRLARIAWPASPRCR